MSESPYRQFIPARAKISTKAADLTLRHIKGRWAEQKIDGQRYLIHTDCQSLCGKYRHGLTSRRVSVGGGMVEKHDRVPHIAQHDKLPRASLLDTELVSSGDIILKELPGYIWDKLMDKGHPHMTWLLKTFGGALPTYPHVGNTVSIMGSTPANAIAKQEEKGFIWSYAFDIINFMGTNLLKESQVARRTVLAASLQFANPEDGVILMPAWKALTYDETHELFSIITSRDASSGARGEGLILKGFDHDYNHANAWMKVKKDFAADVVFTGRWEEGKEGVTGKMLGLAGKFEIGVYKDGLLYPIGWISAIMDSEAKLAERTKMAIDGTLADQVIEVHFNKWQRTADTAKYPLNVSLQHPRFGGRFRDDKNPEDCTYEALLEICKR